MVVWEYLHRWHTSVTISRRVIIVVGLRNLCHKMQFYRTSLFCLFSNQAKLISIRFLFSLNFFLLNFCLSQFQVFQRHVRPRGAFIFQSSLSGSGWLLLADRNCYGPIFGFQSSLSGSGYFCLLWAPSSALSTTGRSTPVSLFPYNGLTIMLAKERSFFKQLCGGRGRSLSFLPFRKKIPVGIVM